MEGIVDIEFFLSIVVFVVVISFVSMMIVGNMPLLRSSSVSNDLRSRAYQASYQLVFYKGLNEDGTSTEWDAGDVSQLGLAKNRYRLDMAKINELYSLCSSNYSRFRELLAQDFRRVVILNISTPTASWQCSPSVVTRINPEFRVIHLAELNGESATITLSVI